MNANEIHQRREKLFKMAELSIADTKRYIKGKREDLALDAIDRAIGAMEDIESLTMIKEKK
jgi:hypothetical protein